jgi:DNA-binding transcriptional regulator YiaG
VTFAIDFLRKAQTNRLHPEMCWPWIGAGKGNGYGHTSRGPAHRVSYELFVGPVPEGMDVCHKCDNRACVNPDHLFLGTRAENMADMKAKGRGAGGCRKHLREHQIQEIRRRLAVGVPQSEIARAMNINRGTVSAIKQGKSYVG